MKVYYVGCRTTRERNARGRGLRVFTAEPGADWKELQLLGGLMNPSFLCFNPEKTALYTVHGDQDSVSAFQILPDHRLRLLNTVKIEGLNPVHLCTDPSGRYLLVACHRSGTIVRVPILQDGALSEQSAADTLRSADGTLSHPHQLVFDRTGTFVIVPAQGKDTGHGLIAVYRFHPEDGSMQKVCEHLARSIAEPRHTALHPNNRFLYCLNEWDYTLTLLYFDEATGALTPKRVISTLPEDWTKEGWASAIDLDPRGEYLYTTDRNYNTVFRFRVDQETGALTRAGWVPTNGTQPRFMTVDPDTGHILAANECSDTIVEYAPSAFNDAEDARQPLRTIESESVVCIIGDRC